MTKTEQNRVVAWRLKLLHEASVMPRNVAQACRHFGLSRNTFYKWKARHRVHGEAGLLDRPRVPHRSPRATPREVVTKILYLRQRYHFGPGRIAAYLRRFHGLSVACSSVHRILIRHGMGRLPANQKRKPTGKAWQRYEKPQPGHRLQLDVKFLERIPGTRKRLYQFTAIDDCTRIRVLKIYDACNQTSAIRFVDEVIRRLPFRVLVIQRAPSSDRTGPGRMSRFSAVARSPAGNAWCPGSPRESPARQASCDRPRQSSGSAPLAGQGP